MCTVLSNSIYYFDLNQCVSANSQPGSEASSDSSEDVDYMPEEDKENKKVIQVGHDYQATVPEGFYHYGDAPPYENEDRLLWNPSKIEEDNCESPPLPPSLSLARFLSLFFSPLLPPWKSMCHFFRVEIGMIMLQL